MKTTSTTISLDQLRLYGYHGVTDEEQRIGNHFCIDVTMQVAPQLAALRDDRIEATVNYAEVYAVVRQVFATPSRLIENAAWRIADTLLLAFPLLLAVTVKVAKLNPPMGADIDAASVTICAERD